MAAIYDVNGNVFNINTYLGNLIKVTLDSAEKNPDFVLDRQKIDDSNTFMIEFSEMIKEDNIPETNLTPEIVTFLKELLKKNKKRTNFFNKRDIDVVNVLDEILTPEDFEYPNPLNLFENKTNLFVAIGVRFNFLHIEIKARKLKLNVSTMHIFYIILRLVLKKINF